MFHFGCSVLYSQFFTGLLKLMVWYRLLMPGGILCSAVGKNPLYLDRRKLPGKMILHKVCRSIGSLVVVDFSGNKRRKTITTNLIFLNPAAT